MGIFVNKKILNELYLGKTDEMKRFQKCINKVREEFLDDTIVKHINVSNSVLELDHCIEDIFGFKYVSFSVIWSECINCCTIPIGSFFNVIDPSKNLITSDKSIKFNKNAGYTTIIMITSGLFADKRFTNEEMAAIILHEIGHSFQNALNKKDLALSNIYSYLQLVDVIIDVIIHSIGDVEELIRNLLSIGVQVISCTTFMTTISIIIDRKLSKLPIFRELFIIRDTFVNIYNIVISFISKIKAISVTLMVLPYLYGLISSLFANLNPLKILRFFSCYNNEKMADSFAVIYGYGEELATGLAKLEYTTKVDESVLDIIVRYISFPFFVVSVPLDEHPDSCQRLKEEYNYISKELQKNSHRPEITAELKSQEKKIGKIIDQIENKMLKLDDLEINTLRLSYSAYIHNAYGADPKEFMKKNKDNFEQIEKEYKNHYKK